MALSVYVRWAGVGTREEEVVFEPFQMEVLNGTGEKGIAVISQTTKSAATSTAGSPSLPPLCPWT